MPTLDARLITDLPTTSTLETIDSFVVLDQAPVPTSKLISFADLRAAFAGVVPPPSGPSDPGLVGQLAIDTDEFSFYDGTKWITLTDTSAFLPLLGGTLTGGLTVNAGAVQALAVTGNQNAGQLPALLLSAEEADAPLLRVENHLSNTLLELDADATGDPTLTLSSDTLGAAVLTADRTAATLNVPTTFTAGVLVDPVSGDVRGSVVLDSAAGAEIGLRFSDNTTTAWEVVKSATNELIFDDGTPRLTITSAGIQVGGVARVSSLIGASNEILTVDVSGNLITSGINTSVLSGIATPDFPTTAFSGGPLEQTFPTAQSLAEYAVTDAQHAISTSNPHAVTAVQLGLGNVDDTSDLDKPLSTATIAALALKQDTVAEATNGDVTTGTDATYKLFTSAQLKLAVDTHGVPSEFPVTAATGNGTTYNSMQAVVNELDLVEEETETNTADILNITGTLLPAKLDTTAQAADVDPAGTDIAAALALKLDTTAQAVDVDPAGTDIAAALTGKADAVHTHVAADVTDLFPVTSGVITLTNTQDIADELDALQGVTADDVNPAGPLIAAALALKQDVVPQASVGDVNLGVGAIYSLFTPALLKQAVVAHFLEAGNYPVNAYTNPQDLADAIDSNVAAIDALSTGGSFVSVTPGATQTIVPSTPDHTLIIDAENTAIRLDRHDDAVHSAFLELYTNTSLEWTVGTGAADQDFSVTGGDGSLKSLWVEWAGDQYTNVLGLTTVGNIEVEGELQLRSNRGAVLYDDTNDLLLIESRTNNEDIIIRAKRSGDPGADANNALYLNDQGGNVFAPRLDAPSGGTIDFYDQGGTRQMQVTDGFISIDTLRSITGDLSITDDSNVERIRVTNDSGDKVFITGGLTVDDLELTGSFTGAIRDAFFSDPAGTVFLVEGFNLLTDATGTNTANLPAIVSPGMEVSIKNAGNGAMVATYTVTPNGADTIEGGASLVMNTLNEGIVLKSSNSGWYVVGRS